ncbi:MAG: hypothetical protein HKN28_06715 [Alphaproteobacteria bacterium]|nr:hypothetical protein [Alphaproteobacteria bacterium]
MNLENNQYVVGVFREVGAFERALDGLLRAGFDPSAVSVLGSHEEIIAQFGRIPRPEELADNPKTPRESLETESTLHKAVDFIAGTLAVISEVGTAAAAYAIGGPVGVAAASADLTDTTVDNLLSDYVDDHYREQFEENLRDGGMICWVLTPDNKAAVAAAKVLALAGGRHIHETDF